MEEKLIKPVLRATSLVERSREQLESLILSGSLQPGELLPTERELGKMLGVSRTVVRETVRLLAAKGLVEVTPGSGTYVRAIGPSLIRDSVNLLLRANRLTPEQIYEVRSFLEITVAGLAAERAGPEGVAAIEEEMSTLRPENSQPADYARHDFLLHIRLAEATSNPLFLALINSISTVMIRTMSQMYAAGYHKSDFSRQSTEEHCAIVAQVKQHHVDGARQAMADHMTSSLRRMREAQRLRLIGEVDFSLKSE